VSKYNALNKEKEIHGIPISILSKHKSLTKDQLDIFKPNDNIIKCIDSYCSRKGLKKNKVKVLDWGCGKGLEVLWLNLNGYNVVGVDLDEEPIHNGLRLAEELGLAKDSLQIISNDNKTPYCNDYFDLVYSNQCFEHVKDIDTVAKEIYRITNRGGEGYHELPAFLNPYEGHLYMPFVHWLPKNRIRYLAILFFVLIKREPFWVELNEMGLLEKGMNYYKYSISKTFYRSTRKLTKVFSKKGFTVKHGSYYIPEIHADIKYSFWHKLKKYLKINFHIEELYLINHTDI
jgi:SAM-dependent methyltransferase